MTVTSSLYTEFFFLIKSLSGSHFRLFCSTLMFRMKLLLLVFISGYVFIASCFSFHYMAFDFCATLLTNLEILSVPSGVHLKSYNIMMTPKSSISF